MRIVKRLFNLQILRAFCNFNLLTAFYFSSIYSDNIYTVLYVWLFARYLCKNSAVQESVAFDENLIGLTARPRLSIPVGQLTVRLWLHRFIYSAFHLFIGSDSEFLSSLWCPFTFIPFVLLLGNCSSSENRR